MKLLYLARFTRFDILFAVTVLSSKCSAPNQQDFDDMIRVLRYLRHTPNKCLVFVRDVDCSDDGIPTLRIWGDASHGLHPDGRGHGAIGVTAGSAPLAVKSWKIKHVCLSSTEAEISVGSEACALNDWFVLLFSEIGIPQSQPTVIYQDNKSAILMHEQGHGSHKRSKHMIIRREFIKEHIDALRVRLVHLKTTRMWVDMMTKAIQSPELEKFLEFAHLLDVYYE